MPLIRHITCSSSRLLVWAISEPESELFVRAKLSVSDCDRLSRLHGERRRSEWLAVRAALRETFPEAGLSIGYSSEGAPLLSGNGQYISVSHTDGYAAVLLSDRPCGIDIERPDRNFGRVASRFLSEKERKRFGKEQYGLLWGAKEALFKAAGKKGVDFQRDMEILRVEGEEMLAFFGQPYRLRCIREKRWVAVYTV